MMYYFQVRHFAALQSLEARLGYVQHKWDNILDIYMRYNMEPPLEGACYQTKIFLRLNG